MLLRPGGGDTESPLHSRHQPPDSQKPSPAGTAECGPGPEGSSEPFSPLIRPSGCTTDCQDLKATCTAAAAASTSPLRPEAGHAPRTAEQAPVAMETLGGSF